MDEKFLLNKTNSFVGSVKVRKYLNRIKLFLLIKIALFSTYEFIFYSLDLHTVTHLNTMIVLLCNFTVIACCFLSLYRFLDFSRLNCLHKTVKIIVYYSFTGFVFCIFQSMTTFLLYSSNYSLKISSININEWLLYVVLLGLYLIMYLNLITCTYSFYNSYKLYSYCKNNLNKDKHCSEFGILSENIMYPQIRLQMNSI